MGTPNSHAEHLKRPSPRGRGATSGLGKVVRDARAHLWGSGGQLKGTADWRRISAEVSAAGGTSISTAEEVSFQWLRSMAVAHLSGKGKAMTLAEGAAAIA